MMTLPVRRLSCLTLLLGLLFVAIWIRWPLQISSQLTDIIPNTATTDIPPEINEKFSSLCNVIIEGDTFTSAKATADHFYQNLVHEGFKDITYHIPEDLTEKFLTYVQSYPFSFLTEEDRFLLKQGETHRVAMNSVKWLATSLIPPLVDITRDPFLLSTKYLMSLSQNSPVWHENEGILYQEKDNRHYIMMNIPVNTTDMSVLTNQIRKIKKSVPSETQNMIHLSGTPFHTDHMYHKSKAEITLISALSIMTLLVLSFILFHKISYLIFIVFHLIIAFLTGLLFLIIGTNQIHLLSFVFGTALIGISIDYSFHWMSTSASSDVKRNLRRSFITTICCFAPLLFSSIPLLFQIALFTIGGLVGTYVWVVELSAFHNFIQHSTPRSIPPLPKAFKLFIVFILTAVIILGNRHFNLSTDLSQLYHPTADLQKAETLFHTLNNTSSAQMLLIQGQTLQELLETEEQLTISHIGPAILLPSLKRQSENEGLIRTLYEKESTYINTELGMEVSPLLTPPPPVTQDDFISHFGTYFDHQFIFHGNDRFWTLIFLNARPNPLPKNVSVFAPKQTLQTTLDLCATETLWALLGNALLLICLLGFFYRKKTLSYILPSLLAIGLTLALLQIYFGSITFFHLLSLFIVIGLSIDYTIFHLDRKTPSFKPVFLSFLSSFIGFGLLGLASFQIISVMGGTIALGLCLAYLISLFIVR